MIKKYKTSHWIARTLIEIQYSSMPSRSSFSSTIVFFLFCLSNRYLQYLFPTSVLLWMTSFQIFLLYFAFSSIIEDLDAVLDKHVHIFSKSRRRGNTGFSMSPLMHRCTFQIWRSWKLTVYGYFSSPNLPFFLTPTLLSFCPLTVFICLLSLEKRG